MRAGELRHRATVLALSPDLAPVALGQRWVGIRTKDAADVRAAAGLRVAALVEVRARFSDWLLPGRYLAHSGRLLHITNARDFKGNGAELAMSCEELVGEAAQYTPAGGGAAVSCRVFLTHGVARPGELAGRSEYTTQLEAALIEIGRPQAGAQFQVGTVTWRVAGLVDDDDDRVVRRMWVKRL